MHICKVRFRRKKDDPEELGLLINDGEGPILDKDGRAIEECWNYNRLDYLFSVEVPMEKL